MKTITLCENGNTYKVEIRKLEPTETQKPKNKYINIDGVPHQLNGKTRTNLITITDEMSERVKPKN